MDSGRELNFEFSSCGLGFENWRSKCMAREALRMREEGQKVTSDTDATPLSFSSPEFDYIYHSTEFLVFISG